MAKSKLVMKKVLLLLRQPSYINTSVVKAATIWVKNVNKMSKMESENPVYKKFVDNCFSSLALPGQANRQIQ